MTEVKILGGEGGSYTASIDGVTIPVAAYAVESGTGNRAMVSLMVEADAVQIGRAPSPNLEQTRVIQEPPRRNEPPRSTWGDPTAPDPRANIPGWAPDTPGWQPPPAGADAGRGNTGEYPPVSHRRKP